MRLFLCLMCGVLLVGCAGVDTHEKHAYRELEALGAPCEKVADPAAAAILNVLPGFGDLYLAAGNGANGANWGAFVLDLLMWPVSPVWAVPQGAITAGQVNKKECVAFYEYTSTGRAELTRIKQKHSQEATESEKQALVENKDEELTSVEKQALTEVKN